MTSIRLIYAHLFNRNFSTTRTDKLVEKYYCPRLSRWSLHFWSVPSDMLSICTVLINIGVSYLRFIFGVRLGFSWHTNHVERFICTISPLAISSKSSFAAKLDAESVVYNRNFADKILCYLSCICQKNNEICNWSDY